MGWSIGFDSEWNRDIGYGVPATCDFPGCNEKIDRGLAYVCGSEPYGGDRGCGLYFCQKHLDYHPRLHKKLCPRCSRNKNTPYKAKPDHPEWIWFKLKDASWAEWRKVNPHKVKEMKAQLRERTADRFCESVCGCCDHDKRMNYDCKRRAAIMRNEPSEREVRGCT